MIKISVKKSKKSTNKDVFMFMKNLRSMYKSKKKTRID